MRAKCWNILIFCLISSAASAIQAPTDCAEENALVTISQWKTDLSRSGVNKGESLTILDDGRFRLLRRVQTLPTTTVTRRVYAGKLSSAQLLDLRRILEKLQSSEAPPVNGTFPLNSARYRGAMVKLQLDGKIKKFGFWQPLGNGVEVAHAPEGIEQNWSKSQDLLKRLLDWSQQIATTKLKPIPPGVDDCQNSPAE